MKVISHFINIDLLFSDQGQRVLVCGLFIKEAALQRLKLVNWTGMLLFRKRNQMSWLVSKGSFLVSLIYADMSEGKIQFKN